MNNFLKTTILRSQGVSTSELALLNIGNIASAEQFGSDTLIKYAYTKAGSVLVYNLILDDVYATLKNAIEKFTKGGNVELNILQINGVSTAQTLSLAVDSIAKVIASGSDSIVTYVENGREYIYKADETMDQILALVNDESSVDVVLDGTVTVPYNGFSGGAQSHAIASVTSAPNTIKITGDKRALLTDVAQVTTTGLAATYDVTAVNFTGGETVLTVTQDPAGDSGNVEWTTDNFAVGETVTDSTTGATGEVVSDGGTELVLKNVTLPFNDNDGFAGDTSLADGDVNGTATYSDLDLDADSFAEVINLSSPNGFELIDDITSVAENAIFEIRVSGSTEFRILDGTIKTLAGAPITLIGGNGDWAKFQNRGGVIYQLAGGQYTA